MVILPNLNAYGLTDIPNPNVWGLGVMFFFKKKTKEVFNPKVKILCLKDKSISILHPKKPEHTIFSPIILLMLNISHGKDNSTPQLQA